MHHSQKISAAIDLVGKKIPHYYPLLYELNFMESTNVPTMGTDGKHAWYNKQFVDELDLDTCAGVILHEVLHCVYSHVWRKKERNHMAWNIACDYVVNPVVLQSFPLPKDALVDTKYYNMTAEEVYDSLPESMKQKQEGEGESDQNSGGEKDANGNPVQVQPWGDHSAWKGYKNDPAKNSPQGEDESRKAEQRWKQLVQQHLTKNYGRVSQTEKRQIEQMFYIPQVPWSELLLMYTSPATNDYSFEQPDRRLLWTDLILPGQYSEDLLKEIIFAFDTSGSVTQQMLTKYYMETIKMFQTFHSFEGWVTSCDWELQSFEAINSQTDFEDFKFRGGGGTSFNPVFKEVEARNIKPRALFYFTDLYGDFPEVEPPYPVIWITGSDDVEVPFGHKEIVNNLID